MALILRGFWLLGRVLIGLILGAFVGLAISDYLIRTAPAQAFLTPPLDAQEDSP